MGRFQDEFMRSLAVGKSQADEIIKGYDDSLSVTFKAPQSPSTLAQIKAAAFRGIDPRSANFISWSALLNAAYDAGQREAISPQMVRDHPIFIRGYDAGLNDGRIERNDLDAEISQLRRDIGELIQRNGWLESTIKGQTGRLTENIDLQTENTGLRAEIARLRNPAPEPVKHVASPSIGARWDAPIGMLNSNQTKG